MNLTFKKSLHFVLVILHKHKILYFCVC